MLEKIKKVAPAKAAAFSRDYFDHVDHLKAEAIADQITLAAGRVDANRNTIAFAALAMLLGCAASDDDPATAIAGFAMAFIDQAGAAVQAVEDSRRDRGQDRVPGGAA